MTDDQPVEQAAEVLAAHVHTEYGCLCGYEKPLPFSPAQHRAHVAAALRDAGLLGGQEAVERVRALIPLWLGERSQHPPSDSQIDAGIRVTLKACADDLRAALGERPGE